MKRFFQILILLFLGTNSFGQCDGFEIEVSHNNPTCPGFSDGSIHITITGGTPPYNLEVMDTNDILIGGEIISALPAGWYYIYIIDDLGCEIEDSVELVEPTDFVIEEVIEVDPSGVGECDGSITISEMGGDFEDYYFYWSPDPDGVSGLGANVLTGACAGEYLLLINSDEGCSIVMDFYLGGDLSIQHSELDQLNLQLINNRLVIDNPFKNKKIDYQIISMDGQVIESNQLQDGISQLNVSTATGIYMFVFKDGFSTRTEKFFIR